MPLTDQNSTQNTINKKLPQWAIYLTEILGIVLCVLVATASFFYWFDKNKVEQDALTADVTPIITSTSTPETASWKTYKNEEYGFEVTFNDDWNGYKVVPSKTDKNTFFFCLPTLDKKYTDSFCGGDSHLGYASILYISIFSPEDWKKDQASEAGRSILVNSNKNYYVGYGKAEGNPIELDKQHMEVNQILSTFKFTATSTPN